MRVILSKFRHRSTVTHNITKLSNVQNMCIAESLKLKIWLYGARFGSPHDVQTSSLVITTNLSNSEKKNCLQYSQDRVALPTSVTNGARTIVGGCMGRVQH